MPRIYIKQIPCMIRAKHRPLPAGFDRRASVWTNPKVPWDKDRIYIQKLYLYIKHILCMI